MSDPWRWAEPGLLLADTITKLPPDTGGAVVVCGSHGGRYPGSLAAGAGVRAVVFNDAGIGRDEAGIGSLPYLEALGIAAATVSGRSCTIGDTADTLAHGTISRANAPARRLGLWEGQPCREAARLLGAAPQVSASPPSVGEARGEVDHAAGRRILLLDSASLVQADDAGHIVVTGSHGGLIGGDPALALRVAADTAVFNDAGRPDGPGITRLPALQRRGIAAVTVSAASARIGEAGSTFRDGIVSAVNEVAAGRGARIGDPVGPWLVWTAARA